MLEPNIRLLLDYLRSEYPFRFSIVVADNASVDADVRDRRAAWRATEPEVSVLRLERKGRGHALRTAWLASTRGRRLLHGRRPVHEPRELPPARRAAPVGSQRGRDRHAARAPGARPPPPEARGALARLQRARPRRLPGRLLGRAVRLQGAARRRRPPPAAARRRTTAGSSTPSCSSSPSGTACASTRCRSTGSRISTRASTSLPTIGGDLRRPRGGCGARSGAAAAAFRLRRRSTPAVAHERRARPRPAVARPRVRRLRASAALTSPLAAILALAACLDFWNLTQNGYANTYYAGAVRSMLKSWHNFFFVSFDPGGLVSVDKPPLALWLQAVSAKVFGFSSFSILLPEALAGVGAVVAPLPARRAVLRPRGRPRRRAGARRLARVRLGQPRQQPGRAARAACSSRPSTSARGRSSRDGCAGCVGSAVLVGLAFNTKMLAAMVVVPGIALAYLALPAAAVAACASSTSRVAARRPRRRLGRVDRGRRPDAGRRPAVRRQHDATTARSASPSTTTASAASPARPAARRPAAGWRRRVLRLAGRVPAAERRARRSGRLAAAARDRRRALGARVRARGAATGAGSCS